MQRRVLLAFAAATTVVAAGCFPAADATSPPLLTGEPSPERQPVIIDTDVGLDDIGAMLVLLRDPTLDVRAITIAGTGLAHCQGGRLVVRYLIDEFGVPDIPFGCGRDKGGPDARPFPEAWRTGADAGYGLDITPQVEAGTPLDAVDILVEAVAASPSAPTVVTLGPLTNLEDAFAADPTLPDRIARIHAMLGTIDAPGNVTMDEVTEADPVEWNAFADPSAVAAVFATEVPIDLVPLDATRDVPVPADLADRLATDRAGGGADLFYELLVRNPYLMDPSQAQFLWDELAALTMTDEDLVTWSDADVLVGEDGRLIRDTAGRTVRFASSADRPAVEAAFLEALRRGGPRGTPFRIAGNLTATWDGSTCTLRSDATTPGAYEVTFTGTAGAPSGVVIGGVRAPNTWADLEAFVATIDPEVAVEPPDWFVDGGQLVDEAGSGVPVTGTADLGPHTYGPICIQGTWPDVTFVAGEPIAFAE